MKFMWRLPINRKDFDKTRKKHAGSPGQGITEFALIIPMVLLLIFGLIEMSRLMSMYIGVTMASREAARYATGAAGVNPQYENCNGIRNAAVALGILAGIDPSNVDMSYDDGTTVISANCPPPADSINSGDRIVVTVSTSYTPLVPFPVIPSITIVSNTARTILEDVIISP